MLSNYLKGIKVMIQVKEVLQSNAGNCVVEKEIDPKLSFYRNYEKISYNDGTRSYAISRVFSTNYRAFECYYLYYIFDSDTLEMESYAISVYSDRRTKYTNYNVK